MEFKSRTSFQDESFEPFQQSAFRTSVSRRGRQNSPEIAHLGEIICHGKLSDRYRSRRSCEVYVFENSSYRLQYPRYTSRKVSLCFFVKDTGKNNDNSTSTIRNNGRKTCYKDILANLTIS